MLQLRVISPADQTDAVIDIMKSEPGATGVTATRGAALDPAGDVVTCALAREAANGVLGRLTDLGLRRTGLITIEEIDTALSDAIDQAEKDAPGHGQDAVVWESVSDVVSEESSLSWSYLAFIVIATTIAAIGVLQDQPILIVGAMVVGPEFGPLAGLCVALVHRRYGLGRRSFRALIVGFVSAIAMVTLLTLLGRGVGLVDHSMFDRTRPLTEFISRPDSFSFIVAFLAGAAGVLSLTSAKSGALIGVVISVTTVPAAGNAAVAIAMGELRPAAGSALQLLVNLASIVVAGVITLLLQRWAWRRTGTTSGRYT
ncbi:MAG: DUF389 domain-containing protein [Mycobacteriales bacterium]